MVGPRATTRRAESRKARAPVSEKLSAPQVALLRSMRQAHAGRRSSRSRRIYHCGNIDGFTHKRLCPSCQIQSDKLDQSFWENYLIGPPIPTLQAKAQPKGPSPAERLAKLQRELGTPSAFSLIANYRTCGTGPKSASSPLRLKSPSSSASRRTLPPCSIARRAYRLSNSQRRSAAPEIRPTTRTGAA